MNEPARPAAARPVPSVRYPIRCRPIAFAHFTVSISTLVEIPARAGREPDAFLRDTLMRATLPAAPPQALHAIPHGSLDIPVMLRPSPHSFLSLGWGGHCIAASAVRRPGDSATDPHSGTRDSLPSHSRLWRKRPCLFIRSRLYGRESSITEYITHRMKSRFIAEHAADILYRNWSLKCMIL